MPNQRGFSLIDCMIALLVSGIATSATFSLMQSATAFYRQYRLDRVIADVANHLQQTPAERLLTQDVLFFDRKGQRRPQPSWLKAEIETGPKKGAWREMTCTLSIPTTDPEGRTLRVKRLVWQP